MSKACKEVADKGRKYPKKTSQKKEKITSDPPKSDGNSKPLIEFPHMLRIIGPKHIKILMQFVPSAVIYSVTSLILITYMSEWKTVLQYLPYYNGKYQDENVEKSKTDGE